MASRVKDWTLGPVPGVAARPETYHERWVCDSLEQQIWHLQWATTRQQEWGKTRMGKGFLRSSQTRQRPCSCTADTHALLADKRMGHRHQRRGSERASDQTRRPTHRQHKEQDYRLQETMLAFTSFNITKQWVWASWLYAFKWQKQNCISRVLQLKEGGEEGVGRGQGGE